MPRTKTIEPTGIGMIDADQLIARLPKRLQAELLKELQRTMIPEASPDDYRAAGRILAGHANRGDHFGYVRVAQRFMATADGVLPQFEAFVDKKGAE